MMLLGVKSEFAHRGQVPDRRLFGEETEPKEERDPIERQQLNQHVIAPQLLGRRDGRQASVARAPEVAASGDGGQHRDRNGDDEQRVPINSIVLGEGIESGAPAEGLFVNPQANDDRGENGPADPKTAQVERSGA